MSCLGRFLDSSVADQINASVARGAEINQLWVVSMVR